MELMNIQAFSERAGISKSALRFYEQKKLLVPQGRSANGYRLYADDQVDTVKIISSLRLVDVPIEDIKLFLMENDETKRQQMLDKWISNIKTTRNLLDVSLRYLESYSFSKDIYLMEKRCEQIIWYTAESKVGEFKEHFLKRGRELQSFNIPFTHCYLKYVSGKELLTVQIGFSVPIDLNINTLTEATIEQMPPYICIALPYKEAVITIQKGYEKLLAYALEHQWTPISPVLERYYGENFTELELLLPVTQIEKRGE